MSPAFSESRYFAPKRCRLGPTSVSNILIASSLGAEIGVLGGWRRGSERVDFDLRNGSHGVATVATVTKLTLVTKIAGHM